MKPARRTREENRPRWRRWALLAAGWGFVVLGIAGLVLPVLQGILFLAVGLLILSRESRFARYWLLRLKRRYPRFGATFDMAEARAARLVRRISGRDNRA